MNEQNKYDVLSYPDDRLRHVAEPVGECDPETVEIAITMLETMRFLSGIGLAATQVGIDKRVIVADVSEKQVFPLMLANPEVVNQSKDLNTHEEGCLSLPGVVAKIKRPAKIEVEGIDIKRGKKVSFGANGLLATCLQHEIDHLEGKLFFDHLSRLRRNRLLQEYNKLRKKIKKDVNMAPETHNVWSINHFEPTENLKEENIKSESHSISWRGVLRHTVTSFTSKTKQYKSGTNRQSG